MPEPPPAPERTLYLIDGHHQFFRAYYAIRGGMTSPVTGEPTNAVFAFTAMLLKLFADCKPRYVALVIDTPEPTFRDELYPDYKGQREAPPEDFEQQIPRMLEVTEKFGIPVLGVPGAEADDVMATLATRLPAEDDALRIRLVSKDKDLEQVLADRVTMFDVQENTETDADGLLEKKGITPAQAIDYQTLIGDSVDNVPGVKGIGPKTAVKLLQQFGTVDALVAGVDQLKGKQKENVEHAITSGQLELSRRLVTMMRDVAVDFTLTDAEVKTDDIDADALRTLFRELGFNRHVRELNALVGAPAEAEPSADEATPEPKRRAKPEAGAGGLFGGGFGDEDAAETATTTEAAGDYRCINHRDELEAVLNDVRAAGRVAVDTETIGLGHTTQLCGVCLAWTPGSGVYIPMRSPEPEAHLPPDDVLEALRPVLEDASIAKLGHHLKYDLHVLRHAGVHVRGVTFDSMVGAFLCNAPGLGMDDLALAELGHHCIPITDLIGPKPARKTDPPQRTMDQLPLERVTTYAAEDADITLQLCDLFEKRCKALGVDSLAADVEMPLVDVLTTMEHHGVKVDPAVLDTQRVELEERVDELRDQILEAAGQPFNVDSPKQLGDVLFNQLSFPTVKKTKTGYSTNAEVLEKLNDMTAEELAKVPEPARAIPGLMIEYRMLTKLVGTYFGQLVEAIADPKTGGDGRVHCTFHQTGAATGRLSSSNPNLQNIPIRTDVGRQIRRAFVAESGHLLISADYSQIELRMLAHLSEDEALLNAFREGQDIHRAVAAEVFGVGLDAVTPEQRGHAKMINFGIIYGITAFGLARRVDSLDNEAAAAMIAGYKQRFTGIDRFLGQCVEQARDHGHVTTILGRRRPIAGIDDRNGQRRALAERLAINSVVQGSAADLIKLAMVNLQRRIEADDLPLKMLLQIHDELVLECPAGDAEAMTKVVIDAMEGAMALTCPLVVEAGVGENWFSAK